MRAEDLLPASCEFVDPEREAAFRADRLSESLRHAVILFTLSASFNAFALAGDLLNGGRPFQSAPAIAHAALVALTLISLFGIRTATSFRAFERRMTIWHWLTSIAVAFFATTRTDLALFIVLMRPALIYLVAPVSFRRMLLNGLGAGALLAGGYLFPFSAAQNASGLLLAVLTVQGVLILIARQSNRLRRLSWLAAEAERKTAQKLEESRRLFEAMFRAVPIPLIVARTADGSVIATNDAADEYFGGTQVLKGLNSIRDLYPDAGVRAHLRDALLSRQKVAGFDAVMRLPSGETRDVMIEAGTVEIGDEIRTIGAVIDISARKAAEERVWRSAHHDLLTGLPNRRLFQSRFAAALAQAERDGGHLALILIDLDDFKAVNDALGHDAGDALLYEVAARLGEVVGKEGFVARLGGDEFVVTTVDPLHDESVARARVAALVERILADLRRPFLHQGRVVSARASIGVASSPRDAREASELLKDADLALYAAKAAGRNRAEFYDRGMRAVLEVRFAVAQEMLPALEAGHVVPYYQPKVSLETGRVVGFEALARWLHPKRGLLTPAAFETAFDDPDIAMALGEGMLARAARDLRDWLDAGLAPGRIALNLSSSQFSCTDLAERLLAIIEREGVTPAMFDFEVTETVLLGRSADQVARTLAALSRAGSRIALDDFGTGYASLTHLKQFPVDDIKIDRSFVRDVERDEGDAAIVAAVVDLGRNLGLSVIGEGIETEGQAAFLRGRGCEFGQGYLFAKPVPASRVPWLLTHGVARSSRAWPDADEQTVAA